VWLATNAISPPYISLELGLGGSAISKALKKVCGLDNAGLKNLYDKHGDAGDVAFEAKKRQSFTLRKPKPLTIKGVYQSLVKIANSKGNGSQEVKQRIVERLLQDAQGPEESRYIVRTLAQHLRIGAVKTTMLIALSRAFQMSRPPNATFPVRSQVELFKLKKEALAEIYGRGEELVKACFARRPNYNDLIPCLLEVGTCEELLFHCGLGLHVPLRPMLGSITRDLAEMLIKLQGRDFTCEFKYDGQRAQVHCDGSGKVSIFSRHLEVMTDKYPDLVALVPQIRGEGVSSFILEGEVVAVDRGSGDLKAFQTLTNRARKDVAIGAVTINVCLFAFDLMYLNGEELLDRPFRERRELLRSLFVEVPNQFTWVKSIDATSSDSETVLEFFKSATEIKCEGIMVKVLDNIPYPGLQVGADDGSDPEMAVSLPVPTTTNGKKRLKKNGQGTERKEEKEKGARRKALLATYEPDKRLDSWLKVKKDYNTAADTLDLIPIAAWHGSGRKAKWWSPILLAVRNPETGALEAVTKCISGFTDKFYQANKEKYAEGSDNIISKPSYVEYSGYPDVWFEPQEVWEMAFADITLSPTYTAALGLVSEERGLSMRFPRFLKVREDKSIEEASTSDFLASLWRKQEARVRSENAAGAAEDVYEDLDD
jgi:DNA ligase-1